MSTQYAPSFISTLGDLLSIIYYEKGIFHFNYTRLDDHARPLINQDRDSWDVLQEDEDKFFTLSVRPAFPIESDAKDVEIAEFKALLHAYGCDIYTIEELQKLPVQSHFRDFGISLEEWPAIWITPCLDGIITIWGEVSGSVVNSTLEAKKLEAINAIKLGRDAFTNDIKTVGEGYNGVTRQVKLSDTRAFQIRTGIDDRPEFIILGDGKEHIFFDMNELYIDYLAICAEHPVICAY